MPTLTDIALDAMGSDKAPDPEIKGAIHACRQLPVRVHLVGPEDRLRAALHEATRGEQLPIVIVPATEWISMDEKTATAIRKKPGSTMSAERTRRTSCVRGSSSGSCGSCGGPGSTG